MNVFARFIGVLTAPKATFQSVVAHPRILGMLALLVVLSAFSAALPMTTPGGRQATIDQQVSSMESFGMQVTDQMYEQIQRRSWMLPYQTAAGVLVSVPLVLAIMAGILFAVFNAAMGGDASYKQVYTILVHAFVISTVGQVFTGIINYFRQAATSATNLSVLLPMLDDKSFIGKFAGMVDLFAIWWVIVLSIGLGVLYRRRTQPIAMALFGVYAVIALSIAAYMSR